MKYSLAFSAGAEQDIIESIDWYNHAKKDLGFQFYDQLNAKLSLIAKNPLKYSIRFSNIRATKVERYPYLIYFKADESGHQL